MLLCTGLGLVSLLPSRAEATGASVGVAKARKNVDHLRVEQLLVLRLMRDRTHSPRHRDTTILESGTKLGFFWTECKHKMKCMRPPNDQLLTNPVLKMDYHANSRHERSHDDRIKKNVDQKNVPRSESQKNVVKCAEIHGGNPENDTQKCGNAIFPWGNLENTPQKIPRRFAPGNP